MEAPWKGKKSAIKLQNALDKVVEVFEKEDIEYSLAYGTLLGIIREGKPIENDDDIDLFIPSHEWDKAVKVMAKHFFRIPYLTLSIVTNIYDYSSIFAMYSVNNVQVDLYRLYSHEERTIDCWSERTFDASLYPFSKRGKYSVPKNPEESLVFVYGEDWRIPRGGKDKSRERELARLVCNRAFPKKINVPFVSVSCSIIIVIVAVIIYFSFKKSKNT
jgi:hypothetical protein